ncbi:hypothetical protein A2962_05280 [Candidatus Woesebacteria bacterium RIFCSPLOWO2_01_FULL_39_61]|uniref:Uncharacterized protein n=1 Tax=Candidatus Woesebacteria bacterium RIFCSPHIGHO2_02_FULL_39_13 TaxID=1802505 RepID=A0A1F7Z652_9BACT|nr:MAG: hypothetical protein A2692_00875 [Candidatus Woesebacteria bacterium RIFCSPHIGHO2_01_FULL_39_95]OGM34930.1 MAG: hypothetical protein A3D01_06210 [Candidatus Woesebacteria bacterium RIFCSPHIGHO2_02_FULL_39_13]OGM38946.1 MAG: hypothetical protein A3E13_02100 [Candidatus Woesebacteria bacterium RIFCSPHIGHO2_12_FULL_40_20]OGM68049.1 MAG: hypothetical protein A2962_05280 [Candidatus Woesebacteria bacterium RIFCSPLOWO2_01_FULL_39_61]OGM74093.1 MAG: hypothetical protein A3H19_01430 [Candidatus
MSNELVNQPKVSKDPSTRLPEATKGQIKTICSNSEVEQKRRVNHYQVMQGNTFALKSGKYSKIHPTPSHILNYLDFIDDLQLDHPQELIQVMVRIMKSNLKRITLKEHIELSDGGIGNKQLTQIMKDTFVMAQTVGSVVAVNEAQMHNKRFDIKDIQSLGNEERNIALRVVRETLQRLREG